MNDQFSSFYLIENATIENKKAQICRLSFLIWCYHLEQDSLMVAPIRFYLQSNIEVLHV